MNSSFYFVPGPPIMAPPIPPPCAFHPQYMQPHPYSLNRPHIADNMGPYSDATSCAVASRRRRVSAILAERAARESELQQTHTSNPRNAHTNIKRSTLQREPRRRNLYIAEDATATASTSGTSRRSSEAKPRTKRERREASPDLGLDLVTLSSEESEVPLVSAMRDKSKSTSRKSLALAPRRAPLQAARQARQSVAFAEDMPGADTGKENLPPTTMHGLRKDAKRRSLVGEVSNTGHVMLEGSREKSRKKEGMHLTAIAEGDNFARPKTRKRLGSDSLQREHSRSPRLWQTKKESTMQTTNHRLRSVHDAQISSVTTSSYRSNSNSTISSSSTRTAGTSRMRRSKMAMYPVLEDNLLRSELYEDRWLEHQEIAMTELCNTILVPDRTFTDENCQRSVLRERMLAMYQQPYYSQTYKRLQAALTYGALATPTDIIENRIKLRTDLGLKSRFIALFVDTYDSRALRAAAQAVTGRQMPTTSLKLSSSASSTPDRLDAACKAERRILAKFIDAFIVHHEDAHQQCGKTGSIVGSARQTVQQFDENDSIPWAWRRTTLRSLMLVRLLDHCAALDITDACLFQTSSVYKSSAQILRALGAILLPSLGDVQRPLSHLNFTLSSVQHPLQEYDYAISNLAVDLRDGVKLTRLVEIILLPRESNEDELRLSQHLKYPCISHAQKAYNMQIPITALKAAGGIFGQLAKHITPNDIVDGHREKTLGLLWGLISQCGLRHVVDWDLVRKEIWCLTSNSQSGPRLSLDSESHENLLLLWAQASAARAGLRVSNLTTSFAGTAVLEAIVETYLTWMPELSSKLSSSELPTVTSSDSAGLTQKLKRLGCSTAFISLFTPANAQSVPSSQFTITTLAFLASRLLPLARRHRAASAIQRAWRQHQSRRSIKQRLVLKQLAQHCAVVVRTRERVIGAAVTLQRSWRRVLDVRIRALVRDVTSFQTVARGWARRRKISRRDGTRIRIRGGW